MKKILLRFAAIALCAMTIVFSQLPPAYASDSSVIVENDRFKLERVSDDELVYLDKQTGETATAIGHLENNGDTLTVTDFDGNVCISKYINGIIYINDRQFIAPVDFPETRTCVEITRHRFVVDTRVGNWVQLLLTSAATAIGGAPAGFMAGVITYLQDMAPTTAYIETIRYYCDTPSPRERYVTNYYSDASYTNLEYSYTSETVFQNP